MAHGGFGLFPSSTHSYGEICGGELRWAICVAMVEVRREGREENSDLCGGVWRWWRFGVKEEMRTAICVAVVEVRREGRDGKKGMA